MPILFAFRKPLPPSLSAMIARSGWYWPAPQLRTAVVPMLAFFIITGASFDSFDRFSARVGFGVKTDPVQLGILS